MYADPSGYTCETKDGAENSSGSIYSNEKIVPPKQVNGGRFGEKNGVTKQAIWKKNKKIKK